MINGESFDLALLCGEYLNCHSEHPSRRLGPGLCGLSKLLVSAHDVQRSHERVGRLDIDRELERGRRSQEQPIPATKTEQRFCS
jgi:hypothetical protein